MRKFFAFISLFILILLLILLPPFQEFIGDRIGRIIERKVSQSINIEGLRFGIGWVRVKEFTMGKTLRIENISILYGWRGIRCIKAVKLWIDPKGFKGKGGDGNRGLRIPLNIPVLEVQEIRVSGLVDSAYARIRIKRDGILIEELNSIFYGKDVRIRGDVKIEDKVSLHGIDVMFGKNRITLEGEILPRLNICADGEVMDFEGIFPVEGNITLSLIVKEKEKSPEVKGSIHIKSIKYKEYKLDSGKISFVYHKEYITAIPEVEVYGGRLEGEVRGNVLRRIFEGKLRLSGVNPEGVIGIDGDLNLALSFCIKKEIEFSIDILRSSLRGIDIASGVIKGRMKEGIEIDTLYLAGEGYKISASGLMDKGFFDLAFSIDGFDIGRLIPDTKGKVFIDAGIFGSAERMRVIGSLFLKDVSFKNIHTHYIISSFNLSPNIRDISGELEFKGDSIVFGRMLFPSINLTMRDGEFILHTSYLEKDIRIVGVVNRSEVFIDSLCFGEIENEGRIRIGLSPFEFANILLKGAGMRIATRGRKNEIYVDVNLEDLRRIGIFLRLRQVIKGNGEIKAGFVGRRGRIEGRIKEFVFEDAAYDSIVFKVNLDGRDVRIEKMELWRGNDASRIYGNIPGKGDMEVFVKIGRLGRWVFIPARTFIDVYRGKIGIDVVVRGNLRKPLIYGNVSVDSVSFYIPQIDKKFTDISGDIRFMGERVFIDSLEGKTGRIGTILVYGDMRIDMLDVKTELRRFSIKDWNDMDVKLDGNISIIGVPPDIKIVGEVDIKEAVFRMGFQRRKGAGGKPPPIMFDLIINMPRNVWIRNEFADMQLGGKLRVRKERLPEIEGEMKVLGGYFYYLDKPFKIEKGGFYFKGGKLNPEIDLLAKTTLRYREGDEDIEGPLVLEVGGELFSPTFNLYTEPPLPPLALEDIIPLLNVDMKWEELASMERAGKALLTKAGMVAIRTMILSKIQRIGSLDIDLEANLFGEEKKTRITIGKRLFGSVYATYTKDILAETPDQFKIQWGIRRNILLLGERDEDGNYFGGIEWRIRW